MKTLKLIAFCAILFLSYSINAQTYFTEHDVTIDKLLPKAKKNKLNEKQLDLLTQSYHLANQDDHQNIMELKKTGEPDIWYKVYLRLNSMNNRQNKINTLPENIKAVMNFNVLNLDEEISASKEKAELYICAKANLLFKNPTDENISEATELVSLLSMINPQSNNLDELRLKLVIIPSERIIFRIATPTELNLPEDFARLALDFDEKTIYDVPFDIIPDEKIEYDLMISIMIEEKMISPEKIDAVTFAERNNDKVAKVTDKTMSKSAGVKGKIEFIDIKNKRIIINTPFDIVSTFVHHYAEMNGDIGACSEKTLELLNCQVVDYPSDNALLKDAARKLNQVLKSQYQKK